MLSFEWNQAITKVGHKHRSTRTATENRSTRIAKWQNQFRQTKPCVARRHLLLLEAQNEVDKLCEEQNRIVNRIAPETRHSTNRSPRVANRKVKFRQAKPCAARGHMLLLQAQSGVDKPCEERNRMVNRNRTVK